MDRKKIINIYIIVISIVAVLAIIVGVTRVVKVGVPLLSVGKTSNASEATKLEAFECVKLDTSVCEVNVTIGDDYNIEYDLAGILSNGYAPQIEMSDKTLCVTQKKSSKSSLSKSLASCSVTITVPRDANLKSIEMTTDVGDLNVDDILCKELTIYSHVGDIQVNNVEGELMKVSADVGDIDITKCKNDTISVNSSVGDVVIKDTVSSVVSVDSNIGDVTTDNVLDASGNKPQMDINVDIGDKDIKE